MEIQSPNVDGGEIDNSDIGLNTPKRGSFSGIGASTALNVQQSGTGTSLNISNGGTGDFIVVDTNKMVLDNAGNLSATNLTGTNTGDQQGDGVTITGAGTVGDPFVAQGGGHTIQDEGIPLTQRDNLNFIGGGVTVTDNAGTGATDVTIPGTSLAPNYTITNVTTDRTYDANSTTLDEMADVLGTVVSDMTQYNGTNLVSDTAYGVGWNGDTTSAPSKNAVYDEMELKEDAVTPGTSGNVLTSNGTIWTSAAPAGGGNKRVFLPLGTSNATNGFPGKNIANNSFGQADAIWSIPSDFTSLTSIKVIWTGNGSSGNFRASYSSRSVASSDNITSGGTSDSIATTGYAYVGATTFLLQSNDVTAMANGLTFTAGNIIGLHMERDGTNALDTYEGAVYMLGFDITYA